LTLKSTGIGAGIKSVSDQLIECRDRVWKDIGKKNPEFLTAHLRHSQDPFFQEEIPLSIQSKNSTPESILKDGVDLLANPSERWIMNSFRHRADDIQDVAIRLLARAFIKQRQSNRAFRWNYTGCA